MLTANDTACPIQVPGYTHNGDCSLLCKPSTWKDIIVFFLGNYGAHVATIFTRPGQSTLAWGFSLLLALCFPGAGVLTGLQAITSRALFAPTELTRAVRAGALCIVVKTRKGDEEEAADQPGVDGSSAVSAREEADSSTPVSDSPVDHEEPVPVQAGIELTSLRRESHGHTPSTAHGSASSEREQRTAANNEAPGTVPGGKSAEQEQPPNVVTTESNQMADEKTDGADRTCELSRPTVIRALLTPSDEPPDWAASTVLGVRRLPPGYRLLVLPSWTTFQDDAADKPAEGTLIQSNHSIMKVLISIGQLLFAVVTLYETRGNQIEVYGYAAFGLTVAPYVWMSFINLLANLMCPQYPTMLVVDSPGLDEMRRELADQGREAEYPVGGTVGRIDADMQQRVVAYYRVALKCPTAFHQFFEILDPANGSVKESVLPVLMAYGAVAFAAVPIAIVGGLSRFKAGQSAISERVWTMLWLCLGPAVGAGMGTIIMGIIESRPVLWLPVMLARWKRPSAPAHVVPADPEHAEGNQGESEGKARPEATKARTAEDAAQGFNTSIGMHVLITGLIAWFLFMYMIPAIGGFVVVGKMLVAYGSCTKID
ncbi:hypothetical protein O9K51_06066 [Purpureocillium lavendulum]|uniref:Uncharacterized protein n=1 Tax=Purpureocillium lavendulum TaxID=1247861 RepID=A0AB34FPH3_9HYPO|nr:hypothetical protein O9K51_06066 [Purpureocillium lavendulum]